MFIAKQIFNGDIMLTSSKCFPSLPQPLLTDAKGTKGADIGDDCIRSANVGGIYTRGVCTEGICIGDTCTKDVCIRDICLRGGAVKVVCVESVCASNTCVRGTCAGNAFFAIDACIKGTGPKSICGSAHKPSKSFV